MVEVDTAAHIEYIAEYCTTHGEWHAWATGETQADGEAVYDIPLAQVTYQKIEATPNDPSSLPDITPRCADIDDDGEGPLMAERPVTQERNQQGAKITRGRRKQAATRNHDTQ